MVPNGSEIAQHFLERLKTKHHLKIKVDGRALLTPIPMSLGNRVTNANVFRSLFRPKRI